ncbi:MAG: hypothetical protein M3Q05_00435, partial [Bacteroidota bacterium]|nr:hypothetical protein [Bacteroidota bacterium]
FILQRKSKETGDLPLLAPVFIGIIVLFFVGVFTPVAVLLVNLLILILGILTMKAGADKNHLGLLNLGLLIITALILCRFFDTDLSFVIRGILFVLVGLGFFGANYWLLKKRKTNE